MSGKLQRMKNSGSSLKLFWKKSGKGLEISENLNYLKKKKKIAQNYISNLLLGWEINKIHWAK